MNQAISTPTAAHWRRETEQPEGLGESPFWHPLEQQLYWVDIPGKAIVRSALGGAPVERWPMPSEPGCIAPARTGGLVMALRDGLYRAAQWGGSLTLLAPCTHDTRNTRFNDGKCDPLGRFWAGTMYEPRDAARAELYALDRRPQANAHARAPQVMVSDAVLANGLAWSPDSHTLYWADTVRHEVYTWDWDAQANSLQSRKVFLQFSSKPSGWRWDSPPADYPGRPDGAAVDEAGNYWVALFEGRRLHCYAPDGSMLHSIATPVQCPTMPCFGGTDRRTLYITTASFNRSNEELAAMPGAGCVFSMQVSTPGLPVSFFED